MTALSAQELLHTVRNITPLDGPWGPVRRRVGANSQRYLRVRRARWNSRIVDGLSTIAERITRAGRMNSAHTPARIRSDAQRFGARCRVRFRMSSCCLTKTDSATTDRRPPGPISRARVAIRPGFPIYLPQMAPLYTREPPSARNSVRRTIVQLQRPSPQPTLTWNRPEPLLSGHFSDTAPHSCPFFASLRCTRPRVSLPAPAAPRSSAASRRRVAGSDDLPPAGASSTAHASPAGLQFSPTAAGDS